MKNKLTSLEQQYQDLVFSLEMQPDADFIADLESRLEDGPNKKRGFFWWTFSSASTISMLLYGMMFLLPAPLSDVKFQRNYGSLMSNDALENKVKITPEKALIENIAVFKSNHVNKAEKPTIAMVSKPISISAVSMIDQSTFTSSLDTLRAPFFKPLQVLSLLFIPNQISRQKFAQKQPQLRNKTNNIFDRRFEIQLYSGVNFTRSYLYSDYNLVSNYDLELTASERTLQTKNFGINVFSYVGNFQWGLGMFLTHLGEQANFKYLEAEFVPIAGTLNAFDTIYHPKTFTGKNDYRFIQLPLSLGYEIKTAHFSFIPKYSVAVGLRTGEQIGYYPNRNGIGLSNFFVPNVNIQHSAQAEFRANTKLCFISLSPYLNFNSVKTPPEVLSYRKYINYGVNVGIGVRLK
jgi:hypothetical protein